MKQFKVCIMYYLYYHIYILYCYYSTKSIYNLDLPSTYESIEGKSYQTIAFFHVTIKEYTTYLV